MSGAIYQFLTFENGSPRTSGHVVDRRGKGRRLTDQDLQGMRAAADLRHGVCAFGKVALLTDDAIETFQVTPQGALAPSFCGNSTAAAVAHVGSGQPRAFSVRGAAPDPCVVTARIVDGSVHQTWIVPDSHHTELLWNGRRAVLLHWLNNYAIIEGDLPAGITPEQARMELLGAGAGDKLAIVHGARGNTEVTFHNSNGRHGAAPQTGLASIALAARRCDWLADRFGAGIISYQANGEGQRAALPEIIAQPSGRLQFDMSAIRVECTPLTGILAA